MSSVTTTIPEGGRLAALRSAAGRWAIGPLGGAVLIVLLFLFFTLEKPAVFPTLGNVRAIVSGAAVLLVLGAGLTVVLTIREFDLSFAATIGLSGAVAAYAMTSWNLPVLVAVLLAVAAGAVVGLVNGIAVARGHAPAFIVTLAVGSVTLGVERLISGDKPIFGLPGSYVDVGVARTLGLPTLGVIAIALTIGVWALMRYTVFGRRADAIGQSAVAAELAGLPVARTRTLAFVIMGATAGVAGVYITATASQYFPNSGTGLLLSPYAAAFLGAALLSRGRFGALATMYGVFFIGILETGLTTLGQPAWLQQVIEGVVLLAAVLLARRIQRR